MKNLNFDCTIINDGFWRFYNVLNRKSVVKNVYNRFKETGRFDALRCDWREGAPNKPHIFLGFGCSKMDGGCCLSYGRVT